VILFGWILAIPEFAMWSSRGTAVSAFHFRNAAIVLPTSILYTHYKPMTILTDVPQRASFRQKYFGGAMVRNNDEKLLRALDVLWEAPRVVALDMDHKQAIADTLARAFDGPGSNDVGKLRVPGATSATAKSLTARVKAI
jgi:hypothetical protein